jgi:hypothetical protein
MKDKRRLPRKQANFYLKVYDRQQERLAGNLRDITESGLKIKSSKPLETGTVFNFGLSLPDALAGEIPISFEARSIWCSKNQDTDLFDIGFELINLSSQNREAINKSTDSYLFKDC